MTDSLHFLFDTFEKHHRELYIVGGAVRDMLLGLPVHDYDFCTDALPDEVRSWFDNTVTSGQHFGTIGVILGHHLYEITTYRTDNTYSDGRHPDTVQFSATINEDILRRDFTINALYMDKHGTIFDRTGAIHDLNNRLIRCIGTPETRFKEDKLRKWRCIRIAAEKNMRIESQTFAAILENPDCTGVSIERIQTEFSRILLSQHPLCGGHYLIQTGLLKHILPKTIFDGNEELLLKFKMMRSLPAKLELRLAAFLLNHDETDQLKFLTFFHYPKALITVTLYYTRFAFINAEDDLIAFKNALSFLGKENFDDFLCFQHVVAAACPKAAPNVSENERICRKIIQYNEPLTLKELAVTGHDLIKLGFNGKTIGHLLNQLLRYVYCFPNENNKEKLIHYLERNYYGKTHLTKSD